MVSTGGLFAEWLVGIRGDNGKNFVFLLKPKEHISFAENYKEVVVNETRAVIDSESTRILVDIWESMLSNARKPEGFPFGHDGSMYYFSTRDISSGMIWSPDEETNTGILVSIGELLAEYAEAEKERRVAIVKEIMGKASVLKERLDKLPD
jgi:hypothetical protein